MSSRSRSTQSSTGKSKQAGTALRALRKWSGQGRGRKPHEPPAPDPCDRSLPNPCDPLEQADGPEATVRFRQPLTVESLEVDLGDPVEPGGLDELELGCVPVSEMFAEFAVDLHYQQQWFFRKALIGALSASVALAPGETLSLSMRNTQRKQLDRETLDEVERTEQTESTIADKDILNVTRSSSRTENWSLSGNASFSLSGFSLGASGSMSEAVNEASSSSAQRTSESTRRSASNLKTLQKVQIRETTEITTEATSARTIVNPYRDRSLRLDVYEQAKEYCVEFHLTDFTPVIILNLERVRFDRGFVLTNGAFLADELIDRWLEFELSEALQVTKDLKLEGAEERAAEVALMALEYLFAGPPMFHFPSYPVVGEYNPLGRPAGWDENDPHNSFADPLEIYSGLSDSVENRVSVTFSILAFYHRVYGERVAPNNDGELAIQMAMALDQVLAPRWIGVEETDEIAGSIDRWHATEILRRLGGFLTMTSGILRPLLQPAEEEREARSAAERAEFVIARVVEHLNCHTRYYTERHLTYMALRTRMHVIHRIVEDVLANRLSGGGDDLVDLFDPEAAFLDGRRVIVPIRVPLGEGELAALFKLFDEKEPQIEPKLLDVQPLIVPMDGVHIEPAAGVCVLDDVPDAPVPGPVRVLIEK
jgi:hypothetical protein